MYAVVASMMRMLLIANGVASPGRRVTPPQDAAVAGAFCQPRRVGFVAGEIRSVPGLESESSSVVLPDEPAGVLMVFRPYERLSYALVMKAVRAIHVNDVVTNP